MRVHFSPQSGIIFHFGANELEDGIGILKAFALHYERTGKNPDQLYKVLLDLGDSAEIHNAIHGTIRRRK